MQQTDKIFRSIHMIASVALFVYIVSLYRYIDPDLWGRFASAKITLETGYPPLKDIFSYMPTKETWVDHEWLSSLIYYLVYDTFGFNGLLILKCFLTGLLTMILFYGAIICSANSEDKNGIYPTIYFMFLPMMVMYSGCVSNIRCHLFTYILTAVFITVLIYVKNTGKIKLLYILPLVTLIWTNLHGGVILGIFLIFAFGAFSLLQKNYLLARHGFFSGILSLLTTLVNPYGLKYWGYIFEELASPHQYIDEWKGVILFDSNFIFFKILLLFIIVVFCLLKFKNIDPFEGFLLVFFAVAPFFSQRHAVLFGLVSAIIFYKYWRIFGATVKVSFLEKIASPVQFYILPLLIVSTVYLTMLSYSNWQPNFTGLPVKAAEVLKHHNLGKKILVDYSWGQYILWELSPPYKVSIDGRYATVYPPETYKLNMDFWYSQSENWDAILKLNLPDVILIDHNKFNNQVPRIMASYPYTVFYRDHTATLLKLIPTKS